VSGVPEIDPGLLRRMPLPLPESDDDKSSRGTVLVAGGCLELPGAVLLAGIGALRAGAGKLQLATCRTVAPHLGLAVPEALVIGLEETPGGCIAVGAVERLLRASERASTVLLGPGLGADGAGELVRALLEGMSDRPALVLDAGALEKLADQPELLRRRGGRVVITPHAGEMATLLGIAKEEVSADPLAAGRRAAALLGATVAMKGGETWVVEPDGSALRCSHGHVGLATSGSGDTLAGIVAGLLARGASPQQATAWGVFLHAEAGHRLARSRGPLGFLARELLAEVPSILADLGGDGD